MRKIALVLILGFSALPLWSQHVHGAAEMEIGVTGSEVEIRLVVPGADIVGFETRPETHEEVELVERVVETLEERGAEMFVFRMRRNATAEFEHLHVEAPEGFLDHDDHEHEEGEEHHDDDHEHEHDEGEDHDDHDHDHDEGEDHDDHEHHEGEVHSEFVIEAHIVVSDWSRVRDLSVEGVFELIPSLVELSWVALTPEGQFAGEATPRRTRLTF